VVASVLSCFAFAGMVIFHHFLQWLCQHILQPNPGTKTVLQALPLALIGIASLGRILMFSQYLPKRKVNEFAKKLIAYLLFLSYFCHFLIVYSFGSDHFRFIYRLLFRY
jgi:hypothetical protein